MMNRVRGRGIYCYPHCLWIEISSLDTKKSGCEQVSKCIYNEVRMYLFEMLSSGTRQSGIRPRRGVVCCSRAGLDMETMFRKEGAAALVLDRFLVLQNPVPSRGAYEGAIQVGCALSTEGENRGSGKGS